MRLSRVLLHLLLVHLLEEDLSVNQPSWLTLYRYQDDLSFERRSAREGEERDRVVVRDQGCPLGESGRSCTQFLLSFQRRNRSAPKLPVSPGRLVFQLSRVDVRLFYLCWSEVVL